MNRHASMAVSELRKRLFPLFFLALFFSAGIALSAQPDESPAILKKSSISGRLLLKDGTTPLSGGQVMFFNALSGPPPSSNRYQRIPDIVASINSDGSFSAALQPGKYYITAITRQSRERIGPPRKGDFVYKARNEKGDFKIYTLTEGQHLDLGTISEAVPFERENSVQQEGFTAIEGVVVDTQGNAVADAVVVAFTTASRRAKPLYASEKTGKDGKYMLGVTAGTYYIKLRKTLPGPPQPGQIVGFYGDSEPFPVSVKEGEVVKGINIRSVPFPGRGPVAETAR